MTKMIDKTWYSPDEHIPPQGYKVLCKSCGGDYYVCQRMGDYWFPMPFIDSQYAKLDAPDYWQHIDFHGNNKGYVLVLVEGEECPMTLDEIEQKHFITYKEMKLAMYKAWKNSRK